MALYRQDSTGFLCEFASAPGAGYTAVTAMPGDTEGRVTWWRDRCVDAALGQESEWHPTLAGTAESSTGRSGDGKNYLPILYAPIVQTIGSGTGDVPVFWDGTGGGIADSSYPPPPSSSLTALDIFASSASNTCHLGSSASDYNMSITPNSVWLVSGYAWPDSGGARSFKWRMRSSGGTYYTSATMTTGTALYKFVRFSAIVDMSASSATSCVFCIQLSASGGGNGITFADLMVEKLVDNGTVPSAFVSGVS